MKWQNQLGLCTDEVDCSLYEIDDSYIQESPPKGVTNGTLAKVGVGVDVLSILEISEVDGYIAIQIRLNLTWYNEELVYNVNVNNVYMFANRLDSRLTLLNLKSQEAKNFMNLESRSRIWTPQLIFHNTENKIESLIDDKAFATVLRNGSFTRRDLTHLHNAYLYK